MRSPSLSACGALAQLGERNTGSVEVTGSIPVGSTILMRLRALRMFVNRLSRKRKTLAQSNRSSGFQMPC
jgi:hypothetical protein